MRWIISILILSLLVIVHEFGHFLLAKLNGVEVREFSIGFGPRLLSTTFRGTQYSLKLLPFGGSCRMKSMLEDFSGEEEDLEQLRPEEGSFESASLGQRASIVLAGPFFNFLLAFVGAILIIGIIGYDPAVVQYVSDGSPAQEAGLQEGDTITSFMGGRVDIGRDIAAWSALHTLSKEEEITVRYERGGKTQEATFAPNLLVHYVVGMTTSTKDTSRVVLASVSPDSPMEQAGFQAGDVLTAINGTPLTDQRSLNDYLADHPLDGSELTLTYLRNEQTASVSLIPARTETPTLGFQYNLGRVKTTPLGVLKYAVIEIRYQISTALRSLGALFTGYFHVKDLSGPVGIVDMVSRTYESSKPDGILLTWLNLVNMVVLLSANLGVMNLLPIPGVDGGKLVGIVIEAVRGKRVSLKLESSVTLVSAMLLLALMLYVMYNDILRLLS